MNGKNFLWLFKMVFQNGPMMIGPYENSESQKIDKSSA
jgi:hypothetical protein